MRLGSILGALTVACCGSAAVLGCESESGSTSGGFSLPDFDGGVFVPNGTGTIETTLTSRPDPVTNKTEARFEFTSSRPGKFACRLDAQAPAECSSPFTAKVAEGQHTFEVAAFAADGAADTTPEKYQWTVDVTPPKTTITKAPPDLDSATTVSFEFTASESATFRCALDSALPAACTSPFALANVTAGSHTFTVIATDTAGNVESPGTGRTWTVDTSLPDTTIDSGPSGAVATTTSAFTFSSPGSAPGITFECAVDTAAFAACTSPHTVTSAADGPRTFRVRARNGAGNVDPSPAERTWTVDTSAPTVSITGGPNGPTNDTTPAFTFVTGGNPSVIECRADSSPFLACTSPWTTTGLVEGAHKVDVQVKDAAGNTTVATRNFTVDSIVPSVSITSGPSGPTNTTTPTFGFSAEAGTTTTCRVDAAAFVACSSPFTTATLGIGPHTFEVRATDVATNFASATRAFTVDTQPPIVTITGGPNGPTNQTSGTFTFSVNETTTNQCRVGVGAFSPCTTSFPYGPLTVGSYTFEVQASDAAGNTGVQTRAFTVDTVPPTVTFTSGPSGPTNITSPSFGFSVSGGPATTSCRYDTFGFAPCTSPYAPGTFANGTTHTVYVRAIDAANNPTIVSRTFTIDTTPPTVAVTSGPTSVLTGSSVTFTFSTSGASSTACRVYAAGNPSGTYTPCASPYTFTAPGVSGSWILEVRATDAAGNSATATRSFGTYIIG